MDLRSALQRVRTSSQFYQEAMDQLGVSALFLNAAGQLVHANETGTALLHERNGLCLRDGKLSVSEGRSGEQFRTLLRSLLSADSTAPQGMRLLDDHGATLLEIVGRRLPAGGAPEAKMPAAVLLVTSCQQDTREPCANLLRDLYGFTACEARLAKLLVQGYSTQEAAQVLSVSINTVKTHLKGIFEKTGYNKQSQVVAALNNSALRLI
jgi:DNA-binding CsgD family transcriptional regulator